MIKPAKNEMRVILTGYTCIKGKQYRTGEEILIKRKYIYNVCSYLSSVLRGEPKKQTSYILRKMAVHSVSNLDLQAKGKLGRGQT